MNEEIFAYIDGRIAELREYIDQQLQQHGDSIKDTIFETVQEMVPWMVADIIENTQQQ